MNAPKKGIPKVPPKYQHFDQVHHHHRPLIPLSGVGTTCFFRSFSSITRHVHAHSFYSHVILHSSSIFP
jgi:hypothetical protein